MTEDEFLLMLGKVFPRLVLPNGQTVVQAMLEGEKYRSELDSFIKKQTNASERVVDLLEGPVFTRLDGSTDRHREEGLISKVDHLTDHGIKMRIPAPAWVAILVACIAGVSQIVANILGG